ncbi:MAG: ABC transporter [Oscillospiraceae bacterium]|nr:ABC transporter [Oscillospiraceae bacterium]
MTAVFKHELSSHFKGLTGYVFGAFLLLFVGIYTLVYNLSYYSVSFEPVLGNISFIFMVLVPILTMRVLSEERRQKTDQLLYSLPISMTDVVLGKYLAMLVVFAIPMAIVALYPLVLSSYGQVNQTMAYSAVGMFYLLGAALIAMGTFVSAMTESQATSAGLCFVVMLLNYFVADFAQFVPASAVASLVAITILVLIAAFLIRQLTKNTTLALAIAAVLESLTLVLYMVKASWFENLFPNLLKQLSLYQRFYNVLYGEFDLGGLVYYFSVIGVFLFLTVQSMEKRRWSE